MYSVSNQFYAPVLREKGGERQAALDLHAAVKPYILPTWIALPLTAKENVALSVTDVMKREVGRVQSAWGNNVCLWDPRYLVLDPEPEEDARYLQQVLAQFAAFGCQVIPVVSLRESFTRLSVVAGHSRAVGSGLGVRIEFNDIGDYELLDTFLVSAQAAPKDCVLLLDLTDADLSEHDEFARFLVEAIDALGAKGNWARIVVAGSSYPFKNPADQNGEASPERAEWMIWEWALRLNPNLADVAVYGDFGADNARFSFDGGGIPIPHLRYALQEKWWVVRGGKKPATIRDVAARILKSANFMGRAFSAGDEFIADCAAGVASTGDAPRWRAANMNHHFMVVLVALAQRYGVALEPRVARTAVRQISLLGE